MEGFSVLEHKMKQIKFSQKYEKFNDNIPRTVVLLEVFKVKVKDLHPRFIEYDTIFWNHDLNNWSNYSIKHLDIVLVLLFKYGDRIFTTIRRFTGTKYDYYKKSRGEDFNIVMG